MPFVSAISWCKNSSHLWGGYRDKARKLARGPILRLRMDKGFPSCDLELSEFTPKDVTEPQVEG
jgi:hypothetical protein